jgi:hypothetical protein
MPFSSPRWISKIFPPNHSRVCCPPGKLEPGAKPSVPLVVVAAFPRSGTHVLIDLLLNNFPDYRRRPLYVNLDEYITQGRDVDELIRVGGYIVKTHYPEPTFSARNAAAYEKVFANAVLLKTTRPGPAIFESFQTMVEKRRRITLEGDLETYRSYWAEKHPAKFLFDSLIDPERTEEILDHVQKLVGVPRAKVTTPPPPKSQRYRIYVRKLLTRLLGCRLRRVNTTIGFHLSPSPKPQTQEALVPSPTVRLKKE